MQFSKINKLAFSTLLIAVASTIPFKTDRSLAQTAAINLNSTNARTLNWHEAFTADANAWTFTGSLGNRNDLVRVYYNPAANLYIRLSVAQRWNWNGKKAAPSLGLPAEPDANDNPYVPTITDYSHYGTGGYTRGENLLAIGINTTDTVNSNNIDGQNQLDIEFFSDAALTQKAEVSSLNFVVTDLDSGNSNTEQIIVNAVDINGLSSNIYFDRPEDTNITDSQINTITNTVTGIASEVNDSSGNIAPVVMGQTHKLSLIFKLQNTPTAAENLTLNKYTYISNLAWGGEYSDFPGDEPVDIPVNIFAD
jgi:hypothetical protein